MSKPLCVALRKETSETKRCWRNAVLASIGAPAFISATGYLLNKIAPYPEPIARQMNQHPVASMITMGLIGLGAGAFAYFASKKDKTIIKTRDPAFPKGKILQFIKPDKNRIRGKAVTKYSPR